jgi:hypothetical protein
MSEEFIEDQRLTDVDAWEGGLATDGQSVAVVVRLVMGEDVQIEDGGELIFTMGAESAARLGSALVRYSSEALAWESAERN